MGYGHAIVTSQRDNVLVILIPFSRRNLIDDINISKFLENDTSRYKCTSGDSRGWDLAGGGGGHHFFLKKTVFSLHLYEFML